MHQVHNDISLPKTFWLSLWGKRKKSNVNFLSITLGYFVKNVQMKSYDFIINMCLFHPTHSMALRTHWYIHVREKMNWNYSIKNMWNIIVKILLNWTANEVTQNA